MTTNPFARRRLLLKEKETLEQRIRDIDDEVKTLRSEIESEVSTAFSDDWMRADAFDETWRDRHPLGINYGE